MTDALPPSSQKKSEDENQGQRMTIYMPPGAVIIERSDLDEPTEVVATQIQPEEPKTSPEHGKESLQSYGSVINIYTGDEARGIKQQNLSEIPTIENAPMNEQQALLRISEMLDVISKRLDHDGPPTPAFIRSTYPEEVIEKKRAVVREDRQLNEKYVAVGFHFDWMHAFNIIYISLILFSMLLPAALHTFFDTEVSSASKNYEVVGIQRGDLLITEPVSASTLVVGDFVSLHDAFSGTSEMIQVSEISAPGVNGEVTIAISPQAGSALGLSYAVDGNLLVDRITKSIPALGNVIIILGSIYVQFLVAAFVIILNIVVHTRRRRRYSRSLGSYAIH